MSRRKKVNQRAARKLFSATSFSKPLNNKAVPMRGGFRL